MENVLRYGSRVSVHKLDGRPLAKCDLEYQWAIKLSAQVDQV
jgi:hypothetical protein